jgi:hypothetical protein
VPGPWTGYYRMHPSSKCRLPPPRTIKEIRQCFLDKRITEIITYGDSIMEFLEHHFKAIFEAAFPSENEFQFLSEKDQPIMKFLINGFSKDASYRQVKRSVAIANLALPHTLTYFTTEQIQKDVEGIAKRRGTDAVLKLFNTSPFMIWERRQYLTAERTVRAAGMVRSIMSKEGWLEVDYLTLSQAWTMDATIERDALHIIAHSMMTMAYLMIEAICTEVPSPQK